MGGRLIAGTCGYFYDDWKDSFYPKDLRSSEYLRFYSLIFSFVELDFSWYSMPKAESLAAMADQTPSDFSFALKAHKSLTHEIGEDWAESADRFARAAEVLAEKDKLAAVLIQLPFRFSYTAENRNYLGELCTALSAFPLVVEFRNDVWYQARVFDELAKRKIALALLDRPDLPGLPPETETLTADLAYIRFHGRNAETWWNGDATSRYDYDYSDRELKDRARSLAALSRRASKVIATFNNHAKGNAPRNAKTLADFAREQLSFE